MNSALDDAALPAPGFPIRTSPDQSLLSGFPKLFAASHVLHRLLAPRHPPCALSSLTTLVFSPTALFDSELPVCNCQRPTERTHVRVGSALPAGWRKQAACIQRNLSSGADRSRTDDLRLARAALSQLSYSPDQAARLLGCYAVRVRSQQLAA